MNNYSTEFTARCPTNNLQIRYRLSISTDKVIRVEDILSCVSGFNSGYHEDFADAIFDRFGGRQQLIANHHGVTISTERA